MRAGAPAAPPRRPTRRAAIAVLLLGGSAAVAAWRWPLRSAAGAPAPMEDDVCVVAPPTPYNPASGLPPEAAREVPADARCPVCGMFPARARAWAAQVIFADGDAHFFDSPLSLMLYLRDVGHYTRGRTAEAIVARYVTDMGTGAWVPALEATYVAGSSARGPMRAGNLPAFAHPAEAARFAQARGGRLLRWDGADAGLLRTLAPARRPAHAAH